MIDLLGFLRLLINLILYPLAVAFLIFYRCLQWLGFQPTIHDYHDHIVLITGSANGLGREIALAFARAGASLALCDIDDIGNRETQQQCLTMLHTRNSSSRVRIYRVDVTRSADIYACAEKVRYDLGQVTILVANAGFVSGRSLLNESDVDIERTFSVNSLSPIWLIKAFLPYMLDANRGHIVIVSSVLGIHASHGPISYVSSKHASLGLSRSLRLDIHATHPNTRVSVHCICPYIMRTKMFNPLVNHVSLKFLLPVVSPRYAANQVLEAIVWRRNEVILPYHLKYIGIINDFLLPEWLSEWLLYQVSGRRPLDTFHRDNDENTREKRRKHLYTTH
ncbi:unnamed protein product [Rotaria sordida]|uniref:Uncharacterized protein n=1 Tax=Rotaria sordida TaxID=392033 RepID=A0A818NG56_9BILA|nr:unnamed protein product [Rotaria sordida]CAF3604650.1 unnamed protein product [Rotaria sordida]